MGRGDAALRAIEQAYAPAESESAWLENVIDGFDGLGLGDSGGYTAVQGMVRIDRRIPPEHRDKLEAARGYPVDLRRALLVPAPRLETASRRVARIARSFGSTEASVEQAMGYAAPPVFGVVGTDARATGAIVVLYRHEPPPQRTKRVLGEIAAHVANAFRLRLHLDAEADAVCAPDGTVLHATGAAVEARAPLALAVKNMDRARGKMRRLDPDEAVASWRALVEGRWSLVDHVERDGKRFVLARRNDAPSTITSLRAREAQVATLAALGHADKQIAYELGIARSTVATHLRSALAKLRLPSRAALVRAFGPFANLGGGRS